MTATLVIVRHGNTFAAGEAPRRIGVRTDLPLVASGHEQARRLGGCFAGELGWRFDSIVCSPLRRTRETADAIRAAQGSPPPLVQSDLLAEIDHGPDENEPEPAVIARIGAAALAAWDDHAVAPAGWIVNREVRLAEWRALYADPPRGTTLLVTSNGAARFALLADPALSEQAARLPSLKLRTGAYGVIEVGESGPRLAGWDLRP